ncbi:hypothetical protein Bbelb_361540 [Branchiostoma belcheri]|nr:hypothetical protein Bbelb_361540 [Branchiostoma belcheri]
MPKISTTGNPVEAIHHMEVNDRCETVQHEAESLVCVVAQFTMLLSDIQGMSKLSAKWFKKIVIQDETWAHHFHPESKQQSRQRIQNDGGRRVDGNNDKEDPDSHLSNNDGPDNHVSNNDNPDNHPSNNDGPNNHVSNNDDPDNHVYYIDDPDNLPPNNDHPGTSYSEPICGQTPKVKVAYPRETRQDELRKDSKDWRLISAPETVIVYMPYVEGRTGRDLLFVPDEPVLRDSPVLRTS